MLRLLAACVVLAITSPVFADDKDKPKPNVLTPKEIADGWIRLFDGETTFGWKIEGDVKVDRGVLVVNGAKGGKITSNVRFPVPLEILAEWMWSGDGGALLLLGGSGSSVKKAQWREHLMTVVPVDGGAQTTNQTRVAGGAWEPDIGNIGGLFDTPISTYIPKGAVASFRSIKVRPLKPNSLFTGKNLVGWKVNEADPKRMASKWGVTKDGELSVRNGPGDLVSVKEFDNFTLQFECKTLGKALNSGVFFRCIPGQYQNGYEAQIQNAFKDDDRTKPADFGTGAIYRRVPARKVVSNDKEWFTMTVIADGKHLSTWVNGYQTVDWTDDRKENENPRQGYRATKGPLSIQGHDPTTDIRFRNVRIAELPGNKQEKKD